jgi:hypothetical protein
MYYTGTAYNSQPKASSRLRLKGHSKPYLSLIANVSRKRKAVQVMQLLPNGPLKTGSLNTGFQAVA